MNVYTTAQGLMSQNEEKEGQRNTIHKIIRHNFIFWEYGLNVSSNQTGNYSKFLYTYTFSYRDLNDTHSPYFFGMLISKGQVSINIALLSWEEISKIFLTVLREVKYVYFFRTVIFMSNLFLVNDSIFKMLSWNPFELPPIS